MVAAATVATLALGLSVGAGTPAQAEPSYPDPGRVTGNLRTHDPSMVRGASGYLLFATHDGIQTRTSPDRVNFSDPEPALDPVPNWVKDYNPDGDVWAPDVSYHHGVYYLYYAASSFGSNRSAIGLAISTTGEPGSWSDRGIVVSSDLDSRWNAIDPNLLVTDDGHWWLTFGSFWTGIQVVSLDPATGKPAGAAPKVRSVADRSGTDGAIENGYLFQRGRSFYLLASVGACCRGVDSTYRVVVGRAASPTGPFRDKAGVDLREGGGTELLAGHDRYIGTGGASLLRDADGDLLVYHYYDADRNGEETLGVNKLAWAKGWPTVV